MLKEWQLSKFCGKLANYFKGMQDNREKFEHFRQRYPIFTYDSYQYKQVGQDIYLQFRFLVGDDIVFEPQSIIKYHPDFANFFAHHSLSDLDTLFFHIGMIELISYWKSVCSPKILIKANSLPKASIDFWKKLYFNGLGEFFFVNNIHTTIDHFVEIEAEDREVPLIDVDLYDKTIVPIGGGKDSVVTLEALRNKKDVVPMIINPRGATVDCAKTAGFDNNFMEIKRTICPNLLTLNAQGYLNGHTPFSAMLAFYTMLLACLSGRKNVALSNENSANEATVIGSDVNHQYSKSLEFESDFRNYIAKYINDKLNYYSFLRPLTELQIAYLFAKNPSYFPSFKSCNVGSKTNVWCGNCAKCLFTFTILSPFIDISTLKTIYGSDLFENESLLETLKELCGMKPTKPFECVGTISEVCLSLVNSMKKYDVLPFLLAFFEKTQQYQQYKNISLQQELQKWNEENFLQADEKQLLKELLNIK